MNDNRLLLVEDDATFRGVLARALSRRGYAVTEARSAEEALDLVDRLRPEFAVIDLKLPGASGLAVVAGVRRRMPAARVLVLTGYASVATAVEAIKLGATHYLAKPADADQIHEALHRDVGDARLPVTDRPSLARLEWEHIQQVLAEQDHNVSATARMLKMHRRTLQRKLAKKPSKD